MSQYLFENIDPYVDTGVELAEALNNWRNAVESSHMGATRPAYIKSGMFWVNNSSNPYGYYFFDGTDDILVGTLDMTSNKFLPANSKTVVDSIASLRLVNKTSVSYVLVTGYYAKGDGGGGNYYYDSSDTTSSDNGGTIIVGVDGGRWKLAQKLNISVMQFGAKGGTTDDAAAFQSALNSLAGLGGTVYYSARHRILSNLTIPDGVWLSGPAPFNSGNCGYTNALATAGASILLSSDATIYLGNGAGICGALIQRDGMSWYETSSAAFAGTAITAAGNDTHVSGCFIAGFNQAFYSVGYERAKLFHVYGDCNNGAYIETSQDKSVLHDCHFWPFVTQQAGLPASAQQRSGVAFEFKGVNSYCTFNECFSYGYNRGFLIQDSNDCVLTHCGADGDSAYTGSIGFLITGNSVGNNLIGCSASGNDQDYYVNSTNANIGNSMAGCKAWNNGATGTGVLVNAGKLSIVGGHIYNLITGINAGTSSASISIEGVHFSAMTVAVDSAVSTNKVHVSDSCIYTGVSSIRGANIKPATKASGVAVIASGTSSVTVPHGLPANPEFYTGVPANTNLAGRDMWLGADATNIYINVSSNVASNATIMWEAHVNGQN